MEQIPRLSDDVLYIISEKLLFKNRYVHFDLRITNGYTLFMSHILESSISVNKMIFSGLLEAGLLHISSIQINKILGKLSKIDFSATNKNIYKYLVNLEDLSDPSSTSSGSSISSIYIIESAETIKKHLITLLSMNIETLEIICSNNGNMFECDAKTFARVLLERPSISINCTKKITTKCTIELNSTTNFLNNLLNYIQFLIFCCPNLESVEFLFNSKLKTNLYSYPSSYESISDGFVSSISPEEFVTYLESFFTSIIDYLKNLEIGGKNLKIKIEFYSSFVDYIFELIPTDNKLFSLGKHVEIKNIRPTEGIYSDATPQFIGRNIEVVDSIGRQHGCLVKILSEKQEEDYYINDDYDNYFNGGYGFDEYAYIDAYSL
uniref:Uncharacterized protein n=1 Tax=Meloidogyne enterolobii TaxID=390850 RepID=A0A6V7XB26_MELEN|nr:unnamed protein product [Meloidogyne enterolobii]